MSTASDPWMSRWVLRYQNKGMSPEDAHHQISCCPGVLLVDRSPLMLLIETSDDWIEILKGELEGWIIVPEQMFSAPEVRESGAKS
jgi:hypothetical protein